MAQTSLSNIAPETYVSSLDTSNKQENGLSYNDKLNDKLYDKLNEIIDILMDIKKGLKKVSNV